MYNHLCLSLVAGISLAQLLKTEDELCGATMEEWRTWSALVSLVFLSNSYMTLLPLGILRRCHHMWFMAEYRKLLTTFLFAIGVKWHRLQWTTNDRSTISSNHSQIFMHIKFLVT